MAEPLAMLAGSILQGGSSLAGSYLNYRQARKNQKRQIAYQREFAKKGIQWRVQDAKDAGIHPLYALGAQTHSYQPTQIGGGIGDGIADAGQAIGGAVSRMAGKAEKKEQVLRLQLLESQIAETDARTGLTQSETARNLQNGNSMVTGAGPQLGVMQESQVSIPTKTLTYSDNPRFIYEGNLNGSLFQNPQGINFKDHPDLPGAGLIEKIPTEVQTHKKGNRGLQAGEHPSFKEYRLPNGLPIMLPAGDTLSEVLEETPMWLYPSIYKLNKKKYGEAWGNQIWDFLMGRQSKKRPSKKSRKAAKQWYEKPLNQFKR